MLPLDRRTGITEVEIGYDEETAMAEARRCLRCWINTVFEGNREDGSRVHPVRRLRGCLSGELPAAGVARPHRFRAGVLDAHPQQLASCFGVELDDVAAEELGVITGSAMLKDETRCIRCGLCALRCPVDTITMEAYQPDSGGADWPDSHPDDGPGADLRQRRPE